MTEIARSLPAPRSTRLIARRPAEPRACLVCCAAVCLAAVAPLPAHALYKIVGPDGRVTYTDREPKPGEGRSMPLSERGTPLPEPALPAELEPAVRRFPVTLYTSANCPPCDEARRMLRQRGIPHVEKTVLTEEDRLAWPRIVGGPETPAITIGSQSLRGFSSDVWNQYLEAAGYPRESKLPPNYTFAPALPLVGPKVAEPATPPAVPDLPRSEVPRREPPQLPPTPGFRF